MMDRNSMWKRGIAWFDAMSVGSLATSLGFYWAYDQWRPLVVVATIVASVKICQHVYLLMEGSNV